jgi:hypothetical protein
MDQERRKSMDRYGRNLNETEKWLLDAGYEFIPQLGYYQFIYKEGQYTARNTFSIAQAEQAPKAYVKAAHANFLQRAYRNETF